MNSASGFIFWEFMSIQSFSRPVPARLSRIRMTVTSELDQAMLEYALKQIIEVSRFLEII